MEGIGTQPVSVGNSLSYQSFVGLTQCKINVATRGGKTTLRVRTNAFVAALSTFMPAIALSFVANIIIWEEVRPMIDDGLPFAILLPLGLLAAAYFSFRKLVRYSNRKVLDLTNRTAAKLEESADHLRGRLAKSGIPLPEVEASAKETRLQ